MDTDDSGPSSDTGAGSRLILLAHGSEDARLKQPFVKLCEKLADELGEGQVALAFLEQCPPSLLDVAGEAVRDGISDIVVLPLFLALSRDVEQMIPRQVVSVKDAYPHLAFMLLPPIGEHPLLTETIYNVAKAFMPGGSYPSSCIRLDLN